MLKNSIIILHLHGPSTQNPKSRLRGIYVLVRVHWLALCIQAIALLPLYIGRG